MCHAENIINAIRRKPMREVPFGTTTCFVVRALKAYSRQIKLAKPEALTKAIPDENATGWQRAARLLASRLEAAEVRGHRIDDEFFCELVNLGQDKDTMRRFMYRAVRSYATHISHIPLRQIEHSLRGIGAKHWKIVAIEALGIQDTITAFERF
ncbi:hypothetical protein [Bordetella sp. FB-8]|uniref:hypothetical protein n=1 Tax=Bordetella sp. FB-8 TaxID=1159870 RepID=UPI00037E704C|nr:hypothetical protein [Bordetella sp. FB-8]